HINLALTLRGPTVYTWEGRVSPTHAQGELGVIGTSNGQGMIVLLHVDREVHLISSFGRYDQAELELAKRHLANKEISERLCDDFRERLEAANVVSEVW